MITTIPLLLTLNVFCVKSRSNDSVCCVFFIEDSWLPASPFPLRFLFISGGDRSESEDMAGDLRRTESDGVLKKVSVSGANYSLL